MSQEEPDPLGRSQVTDRSGGRRKWLGQRVASRDARTALGHPRRELQRVRGEQASPAEGVRGRGWGGGETAPQRRLGGRVGSVRDHASRKRCGGSTGRWCREGRDRDEERGQQVISVEAVTRGLLNDAFCTYLKLPHRKAVKVQTPKDFWGGAAATSPRLLNNAQR